MRFVKIVLTALPFFTLSALGFADTPQLQWLDGLKDVQLYLKPKFDLVRTFDQEFGVQATVVRDGNLALQTNFCYDPTYPIEFNKNPRYSLGFAFIYYLEPLPLNLGIYTKPKYNMVNVWKEETGLTTRLFTSRSLVISANAAYVYNYPCIANRKPNWLALINFQFPLSH